MQSKKSRSKRLIYIDLLNRHLVSIDTLCVNNYLKCKHCCCRHMIHKEIFKSDMTFEDVACIEYLYDLLVYISSIKHPLCISLLADSGYRHSGENEYKF